jgi:hypothetical protein
VRLSNIFSPAKQVPAAIVDVARSAKTFDEAIYKIGYFRILASQGLAESAIADILNKPGSQASSGTEAQPTGSPDPLRLAPRPVPFPSPTLVPSELSDSGETPQSVEKRFLKSLGLETTESNIL